MLLVLYKRFLGKNSSTAAASSAQSPEHTVGRIQQGDMRLRNQFITDYQPFIAKATSRFCKRYIDPARDDEFSVALSAFNEAISQFSPAAGRSFLGFAETVIRRRLIDYVRKEQKYSKDMPFSVFDMEDEEDNPVNPVEVLQALEVYDQQKGMEERRGEILDLARCLQDFDIRFSELTAAAPKHEDSREALFQIGRLLSVNAQLMKLLLAKRQLPIKELLEHVSCSRKTLERNRKYIIAVAIIFNGPYPYLRDYVQPTNSPLRESETYE